MNCFRKVFLSGALAFVAAASALAQDSHRISFAPGKLHFFRADGERI